MEEQSSVQQWYISNRYGVELTGTANNAERHEQALIEELDVRAWAALELVNREA